MATVPRRPLGWLQALHPPMEHPRMVAFSRQQQQGLLQQLPRGHSRTAAVPRQPLWWLQLLQLRGLTGWQVDDGHASGRTEVGGRACSGLTRRGGTQRRNGGAPQRS